MADREIKIIRFPISEDKDKVFLRKNSSDDLVERIQVRRDVLKKGTDRERTDIFLEEDNILITENGYYVAVYKDM